jgi:hypothetical protein
MPLLRLHLQLVPGASSAAGNVAMSPKIAVPSIDNDINDSQRVICQSTSSPGSSIHDLASGFACLRAHWNRRWWQDPSGM